MDIKIDKHGGLWIKRGDKYVEARCPFAPDGWTDIKGCGDWCALMGEPDSMGNSLRLCQAMLFGAITDERK